MDLYREFAPPIGLGSVVACLWENHGVREEEQRVIPDGCVDLVWLDGELLVVGADTGTVVFAATGGSEPVSGIRLRPGAAGAVLGVTASEVRDARVPAAVVWPGSAAALSEALALADPATRLDLLTRTVLQRRGERDDLVAAAARLLGAPSARIGSVAAALGVSERHLHRRTVAAIGYGPKTLGRIARLRRLIFLSEHPTALPLAQRAAVAGYASQAHMSDDVRRLTGFTPVRFLEDARLTAA
jgi:AraC-like DNA-binding protein